jgi:ferritin-like metal-binding protein YciE
MDSQTATQLFLTGLKNAHSMETQARELMERQAERLDDYPEVKEKIVAHLSETEQQLKRLDQCLGMFDESSSTVKDTAQSIMGNLAAISHTVADDEVLKNTLANNAFENYEIAAYKPLLAMCGAAGADRCKPMLETSLKEEEQMAKWVASNVARVTVMYLQKAAKAAA